MDKIIPNEEVLDYCRLKLNGMTFRQIGEKYGKSHEAIREIMSKRLGVGIRMHNDYKKIVYPAISEFMQTERVNIVSLSRMVGMSYPMVSAYIRGKRPASKKFIDKMIEITGISYEKLFERKDNDETE